jgi:hypothetical protein
LKLEVDRIRLRCSGEWTGKQEEEARSREQAGTKLFAHDPEGYRVGDRRFNQQFGGWLARPIIQILAGTIQLKSCVTADERRWDTGETDPKIAELLTIR